MQTLCLRSRIETGMTYYTNCMICLRLCVSWAVRIGLNANVFPSGTLVKFESKKVL